MDLNEVIRLTFRSNGQNWEKYLRWLNRFYFQTFGKYYLPLVKVIYRYNNRQAIRWYLERPELLTTELYRSYGPQVLGTSQECFHRGFYPGRLPTMVQTHLSGSGHARHSTHN